MSNVTSVRLPNSAEAAEREVRVNLAACYRLTAHFDMDDLIFTHISARVPGRPDHFFLNPFELMFGEITASSLVKVDMTGKAVEPTQYQVNLAGFVIHGAVLAGRPDINCVLHTHTRAGVAVSCMAEGLLPLNQFSLNFYNRVAYHDYEGIALDSDECTRLQQDLGKHKAMILRNHGLLTVGRTIPEAFELMYYLDQSCRVQVDIMSSGAKIAPVSPEVGEHTAKQFDSFEGRGERGWPALLRLLDAKDPSYRD